MTARVRVFDTRPKPVVIVDRVGPLDDGAFPESEMEGCVVLLFCDEVEAPMASPAREATAEIRT